MSKHYNIILELKLRLLEEPGEKTFGVPYVFQCCFFPMLMRMKQNSWLKNDICCRVNTFLTSFSSSEKEKKNHKKIFFHSFFLLLLFQPTHLTQKKKVFSERENEFFFS
jgi:hypothetical protein